MRAWISGGYGFVGNHLRRELEDNGYEVVVTGSEVDVTKYDLVHHLIHQWKPDVIFHLAAVAFVPTSWNQPKQVLEINTLGALNIFEAVRANQLDPVIQIAGSSEEYGLVHPKETPITEDQPLRPLSTYGVSKVAMDLLGYQYFKSYGLKIIRTRAFNHEGYGRDELYMTSSFAKQVAEAEAGRRKVIEHGNLKAKRDITDVRDMARAYRLAVEEGKPGEVYNIGTGRVYSADQVLKRLIELAGVRVKLKQDPQRMRPSDVPLLQADSTKFRLHTGWKPQYSLDDTLKELLTYWRERI